MEYSKVCSLDFVHFTPFSGVPENIGMLYTLRKEITKYWIAYHSSLQKLQTRFNCNLVSLDRCRVCHSTNDSSAFNVHVQIHEWNANRTRHCDIQNLFSTACYRQFEIDFLFRIYFHSFRAFNCIRRPFFNLIKVKFYDLKMPTTKKIHCFWSHFDLLFIFSTLHPTNFNRIQKKKARQSMC